MILEPLRAHHALTTPALDPALPAGLGTAAELLGDAARGLDDTDRDLDARWVGLAATAAAASRARCRADADALAGDLAAADLLLRAAAGAQQRARDAADRVLALWWATAGVWPAWAPVALVAGRWACAALAGVGEELRGELDRVARELDALCPAADPGAGGLPPEQARLVLAGLVPPAGAGPAAVARWWARLGPLAHTDLPGPALDALAVPGTPPAVLDRVNRLRLRRDAVLPGEVGTRARAVRATLDEAERAAAAPPLGPVLLLDYSPTGPGRVAVSFGDPSRAATVAVAVPGTTNAPGSPGLTDQAVALRRRLDADDPGTTAATVTWLGYDAPDSLTDPAVASPAGARAGAARLVADVAGWSAAATAAGTGAQRVTVVGHSYGSTVVGLAAAAGLRCDDVVLVGSPGAGVASAAELGVGGDHVWVGATEHDPVVEATGGRWFTPSESSTGVYDPEFGARRFGTADAAGAGSAHSGYYAPGSESLANLSAIARGAPGEVTAPGELDGPGGADPVSSILDLGTDPLRAPLAVAGRLGHADLPGAAEELLAGLGDTAADVLDAGLGDLGRRVGRLGGWVGLR